MKIKSQVHHRSLSTNALNARVQQQVKKTQEQWSRIP
jgi:hypothetical protein